MSAVVPHCDRCDLDREYVRIAGMGNQNTYGVEWRCVKCDSYLLDICPVGPLAPTTDTCLNCGYSYPDKAAFAPCPACGTTRLGALDLFGLDPAPADPVARAEKLFDMGVVRRAVATLNYALVCDPTLEPAWRIKYAFLSGLRFTEAALEVMEAASEYVVNPDLLISYAHLCRQAGRFLDARTVYNQYLQSVPDGEYADLARESLRTMSDREK